jgi:predicted lipoprotein with Yx(FWY)xxD motif
MRHAVAVLVASAVVLSGCGGGDGAGESDSDGDADDRPSQTTEDSPSLPDPTSESEPDGTQRTGTVVTTADSDYGRMLFDKSGQAIYLFDRERSSRPRCYGACAEAWPPVLTKGEPRATGRTKQRLLGTTSRSDGSSQVTYAGHPLYYYAHEDKGEVLCHDVEEYGGVWLVVQPDGQPAP